MRATVTLESDVAALIAQLMQERGLSFRAAINHAIRSGLRAERTVAYRLEPRDLGAPIIPVTKALQLAAELEDEEIVRKLALGK